ncbi:MAG: hypothetical protein HYS08_08220 [Chlamydiae bacterium]|nr:hypothetical protein [Chlamydiota bacterium]MBI3266022.1 hypothetical protein [Chlamydiota bacterium]
MRRIILGLIFGIGLFISISGCGSQDIIKEHVPCGCISTCSCMHCVLASRTCDCEHKAE